MTLPIIYSILRGELRPNIIEATLDERTLRQRMRLLQTIPLNDDIISLESRLYEVLDGLIMLRPFYDEDSKLRKAAARSIELGLTTPSAQTISSETVISGVLPNAPLNSPQMRFYAALIDCELHRTRRALIYLQRAARDDAFMRTTLRELFRTIRSLCQEAHGWTTHQDIMSLIPPKLTEFYFTLYHSYQFLLRNAEVDYDTNFSDFVYDWQGCDPTKEQILSYNEKARLSTEIALPQPVSKSVSTTVQAPAHEKDKVDLLLEAMTDYNLMDAPKLKQIGSPEKAHQYLLLGLENTAHACAMFEYLEIYEHVKSLHLAGYTMAQYERACAKALLGKDSPSAFHNYRMSLKKDNANAENYGAYKYVEQVRNDYLRIQNIL